jgi:hypothetical protein
MESRIVRNMNRKTSILLLFGLKFFDIGNSTNEVINPEDGQWEFKA